MNDAGEIAVSAANNAYQGLILWLRSATGATASEHYRVRIDGGAKVSIRAAAPRAEVPLGLPDSNTPPANDANFFEYPATVTFPDLSRCYTLVAVGGDGSELWRSTVTLTTRGN
jgi:hypothetical protein